MWVIFEGLDKAGKGTLEREFLKAVNYRHIVVDRGPAGYVTFDVLFNRYSDAAKAELSNELAVIKKCSNNFLIVYCKVQPEIAMRRIKEHNETCPYEYENAQDLYDNAVQILYRESGLNVVDVDTSKPIDECVQIIIKKLEEVQKGEL